MSAGNHTLTLPCVEAATSGFVQADAMREAVSLAIVAGENLIFSGPGGHGKSEFLAAAFGAIEDLELYIKSFGSGTSPDELYGGVDFSALNPQGNEGPAVLKYCPELSFLARKVAIFEEAFDAPSRVLTSLKDTLTARALRNGHQYHKMDTSVIAIATNHSPTQIAEGGPEISALIERFPIQLEVRWPRYDAQSYRELFKTITTKRPAFEQITWDDVAALQERARQATVSDSMQGMLANIVVDLLADKIVISPRTAVKAMQLAQAAAAINGRDRVVPQDLIVLAFLPGAYALRERIANLITEYEAAAVGEGQLDQLEQELTQLRETLSDATCGDDKLNELDASLNHLHSEIDSVQVTSDLVNRKSRLLMEVSAARRDIGVMKQQKVEEFESEKLDKIEQAFAPLREMVLDTDLISVCGEADLEDLSASLGNVAREIDSLVLTTTKLSIRKSDLRKEVVTAFDRVNVALDDLRLTEEAKAQRPMLAQIDRNIKALLNDARHRRTVQDRNEALTLLRQTWDDLRTLALHPDLEDMRRGLYDKIDLGLMTLGIDPNNKTWKIPA